MLVEAYIESRGFPGWTHLHPTFYMEVSFAHTTAFLHRWSQQVTCRLLCVCDVHHLQNLISYGGVKTIQNKAIVVPFNPDAKVSASHQHRPAHCPYTRRP